MNQKSKKFTILSISICLLIFLSSCSYGNDQTHISDYNLYDTRYINIGDIIDINFDYLSDTYDFDHLFYENYVSSYSNFQQKISINRLNQPVAIEEGIVRINVRLVKNNKNVATVYYGNFIISKNDQHNPKFIGLNNKNILYYLTEFPNGNYYLAEDIDAYNINKNGYKLPIEHFSGVLINPEQYKISNFRSIDNFFTGFFKRVDKARIDGLIFDDVDIFLGPNQSNQLTIVGVLAAEAKDSLITNIKVEGKIQSTQLVKYIGGIVGYSENSIYRGVSFEGEIDGNALLIGGIAGNVNLSISNQRREALFYTIDRGYVIANLSNQTGVEYIASAMATHNGDSILINNFYFDGMYNDSSEIYTSFFVTGDIWKYNYSNTIDAVYSTMVGNYPDRFHITPERLKSGEPIVNFNGFIYEEGKYPRIERWVKP